MHKSRIYMSIEEFFFSFYTFLIWINFSSASLLQSCKGVSNVLLAVSHHGARETYKIAVQTSLLMITFGVISESLIAPH